MPVIIEQTQAGRSVNARQDGLCRYGAVADK